MANLILFEPCQRITGDPLGVWAPTG